MQQPRMENYCFIKFLKLQKFEVRNTSEKSEKKQENPSDIKKKIDEDVMLCNTLWSDRRGLITKNISCLFQRTSKRRHSSKLSTKKFFFSFLALFREKFRFPAKTFLA